MLNLAQIIEATTLDRSQWQRYLELPEIRDVLGGTDTHPLYPDESLPLFQALAEKHQSGEWKPKQLAARIRTDRAAVMKRLVETDYRKPITDNRLSNAGQELMVMPDKAVALLDQIADAVALRVAGQLLPPPEDCMIDAEAAAVLLCCKPRAVSRYVKPDRPGVWIRSKILRYIQARASLQP